jgi:nitrite reductase/ring-hydroxylating ferredoxin subunit
MSNIEAHAERLLELITELGDWPDQSVRERVMELLEHVDHLHRSGVWKLFELMTQLGGKGLTDRIATDPIVKTLFMLYDIIPVDPLQPVEASSTVTQPNSGGFIPLRNVGGRKPAWKVGFARIDLRNGALKAVEIDGTPVLLLAVGDEVFAYRNACGRGVLPLHLGRLADDTIYCPWHGCRYDARTGELIEGTGASLEAFPVTVRDDVVYVATNVAPTAVHAVKGQP